MRKSTLNILTVMVCTTVLLISTGCHSKRHAAALTMYEYEDDIRNSHDHIFIVWNYVVDEHWLHFSVDPKKSNPRGTEVDFGKISRITVQEHPKVGTKSFEETFDVVACNWESGTGFQADHRHVTCRLP